MQGFSPILLRAFSAMQGFTPNMISCISFYNIFLCLFHRRSDLEHVAGMSCSQTRGAGQQKLLDVASMTRLSCRLEGWTPQNYSMLIHVKTGGQKDFYTVCHDFWILNSKSWNLNSRLGGCRIRVIDGLFFNFLKIQARRLKTEVTLSLILRFNLRLGGYSIWSASTLRTIYDQDFKA